MCIYNCLMDLRNIELSQFDHVFVNQVGELTQLLHNIADKDQYQLLDDAIEKATELRDAMQVYGLKDSAASLNAIIIDLQKIEEMRLQGNQAQLAEIGALQDYCRQKQLKLDRFLLIYASQNTDFRGGENFEGACFGLSHAYSKWRLQYPEHDIRKVIDVLHLSMEVCRAQLSQNDAKYIDKVYAQQAIATITEQQGVRFGQKIAQVVDRSAGVEFSLGCYVSTWFGSTDHHQMRLSRDHVTGDIFLYDPNFGVFRFPSLFEFADAFNQLLMIYNSGRDPVKYNKFDVAALESPRCKLVEEPTDGCFDCARAAMYVCFLSGVKLARSAVSSGGEIMSMSWQTVRGLFYGQDFASTYASQEVVRPGMHGFWSNGQQRHDEFQPLSPHIKLL